MTTRSSSTAYGPSSLVGTPPPTVTRTSSTTRPDPTTSRQARSARSSFRRPEVRRRGTFIQRGRRMSAPLDVRTSIARAEQERQPPLERADRRRSTQSNRGRTGRVRRQRRRPRGQRERDLVRPTEPITPRLLGDERRLLDDFQLV